MDMREGRARPLIVRSRRRFEFEFGHQLAFVDPQQQQIGRRAEEDIRGIDHLTNRRAMNEAFGLHDGGRYSP